MASLRSPSQSVRSLLADPHTPLRSRLAFQGRSLVPRPHLSGYAWSCPVPSVPLHAQGVTSYVMVSRTMSVGVTPLSSLIRTHAPVLHPPRASVLPSNTRSVPVAVSPCWEEDFPDVCCASFPACLDPYPGGSWSASTRFFLHDSGLPRVRTGSALCNLRTATSIRHLSLDCAPRDVLPCIQRFESCHRPQ